jgi:pseudouridine-5'-phosphate glycosidase
VAVPAADFDTALGQAELDAVAERVSGPALTPFLLARLADLTGGKTLTANRELIVGNARLAAEVAGAMVAA